MFFLKEQYRLSFRFLRGPLQTLLLHTTIAFFVIIAITCIVCLFVPSVLEYMLSYFESVVESAEIIDENGQISATALLFNNLRAAAWSILYGLIPFLYLPALSIGLNATVLGAVTASYIVGNQSLLLLLAGLIPHGIFEIPALLLCFACGLYLCSEITQHLKKSENDELNPLSETCKELFRVYVTCAVPLLIVAAVVESFVTPIIMSMFM